MYCDTLAEMGTTAEQRGLVAVAVAIATATDPRCEFGEKANNSKGPTLLP